MLSGYLLHREGSWTKAGGTVLSPYQSVWVTLEQPTSRTVQLKFYHTQEESSYNETETVKKPIRTLELSADDAVCVLLRYKSSVFRILRTIAQSNRLEHVIDEFEPMSSTAPVASVWVKSISSVLNRSTKTVNISGKGKPNNSTTDVILPPAATSTPMRRKQQSSPHFHHNQLSQQNSGTSSDSHNDVFSGKNSDLSGIGFDGDNSLGQHRFLKNHNSNHQKSLTGTSSSGVCSFNSDNQHQNSSTSVYSLLELIQSQRAEIAKLERLLGATSQGSVDMSSKSEINNTSNEAITDLAADEVEIFRLQELLLKRPSRIDSTTEKTSGPEKLSADSLRWRHAYIQSIIGAMKIVVLEQRSVEKLELGLSSPDLHVSHIQELLREAELPSLQQLASDGRYVDDYGFINKFSSYEPNSPDILNFAAGLLMDHYSAQASYSTENEMFWKMHIDMNKPFSEASIESAFVHRRYIPERMRPDIWQLLLKPEVTAARSKHRNDYYSLMARSAGFFGDLEADSSFLDSALTLLTGGSSSSPSLEESSNGAYGSAAFDDSSSSNAMRRQILVDIRRTLPNNIHFGREGRGLTSLYRVLVSFARHKPQLGYCQGINFIAAVLLLLLDNEEDVFWCLVVLTENDRFFGIRQFDSRLTGVRADHKVIIKLFSKHLPSLYQHIDKSGTDLTTCFIPWLMCGFYDCVPFRTLLRIWDYFFMAGYSVFYRVAIALMKVQESALLAITDPTLILKHIKLFPRLCNDFSFLFKVAFEDLQANDTWPSWGELLNQRKKNIKSIEKQDIAASMAFRNRRRTPTKAVLPSLGTKAGPTFVTIVDADRCSSLATASSRLFVWVDDPVSASSMLYVIVPEKQLNENSSVDDPFSTTTMPGFPSNESPIGAAATLLTQLSGQLISTFTQFRPNHALISTVQSTSLVCLDLETGNAPWSFMPACLTEDDPYTTTVFDSVNDIIYIITQMGKVLIIPCCELVRIRSKSDSRDIDNLEATISTFWIFTPTPVSCAAGLTFTHDGNSRKVLLVGAGSFVYRVDLDTNQPDPVPTDMVKIHIPITRHSDSDVNKPQSQDKLQEVSSVRQIVSGQIGDSPDRDMLFWWVLCDGSPCLLLYTMHKTNPMHCQILTTMSGSNFSPNCLVLLPRSCSPRVSTCSSVDKRSNQEGITFMDNGLSQDNGDGLLIGWPNGSIFQWQVDTAKLDDMLSQMNSACSNESNLTTERKPVCNCGCVIEPSISLLPSAPKVTQVEILYQKKAPFTVGFSNDEAGPNILSSVRKALVSTFMPSLSKKSPAVRNGSAPGHLAPVAGRLLPPNRKVTGNKRSTSFLFATRVINSNRDQFSNASNANTGSNCFAGVGESTFASNSPSTSNNNELGVSSPQSSTNSPVRDCELSDCFKLTSVANVFRSDCPVSWLTTSDNSEFGKLVWAFQLEWTYKEGPVFSQQVAVLPMNDAALRRNDNLKVTTHSYTPKTTRHLAGSFLSPEQRNDGWRVISVAMNSNNNANEK